MCRPSTASDRIALKAVVEPMLIKPRRTRNPLVVKTDRTGSEVFLSIIDRYVEKGNAIIIRLATESLL